MPRKMSTIDMDRLLTGVLSQAIAEVRESGLDIYTFAFYHDHESAAVSICVDTEESSARLVLSQNAFNTKHFVNAVAKGNLERAALFQANTGRSLSLGDFALVNIARTHLERIRPNDSFYLSMIRTLRFQESEILQLTSAPQRLLFCSSSADDEVGYLWAAELATQSGLPQEV